MTGPSCALMLPVLMTSRPRLSAIWPISSGPAGLLPILLSYPRSMAVAPKRAFRTSRRYSSVLRRLNSRVKGRISTLSTPSERSRAFFSSREQRRRRSRAPSWSTVRGWGQKDTTMLSSPLCLAASTRREMTKRCPRWTPSKKPVATTILPIRSLACAAVLDS